MGSLPTVRRQQLLAELYVCFRDLVDISRLLTDCPFLFASAALKQACPQGVYVSLTPGDPSLWSGVIFVRKGMSLWYSQC
jgi:hypothetical protein